MLPETAPHRIPTQRAPAPFNIWRGTEDERKHFVLKRTSVLTFSEFVSTLASGKKDGVMVFVHGYANTHQDAIFKAAQIAFDTQFAGIPVAFSWPSKGEWSEYDYDRESALFSRDAFVQLLKTISIGANVSKVYVVAHSMGNQIVIDALAHAQEAGLRITLSEIIMAAPDVDRDVFMSLAERLRKAASGLTLYASSSDRAMVASRMKASGIRAGDIQNSEPLILPGIDTIDVTAVGDDLFGLNHATYSNNRSLIDDLGRLLLASTRPPSARSPQLRPMPNLQNVRYWKYPE